MPTFELICLANSKKHGGRCVAGLRTDGGGWVRPVGPGEEGVLYPHHYRYADGSEPRVLDVIRVGCTVPRPQIHHPEDWLIDGSRWQRVAHPASPEHLQLLRRHLASNSMLLGNWNDRVPHDAFRIRPAAESLALVAPQQVQWVIRPGPAGEQKLRVFFTLHGRDYDLALTDPLWMPRLNRLAAGKHAREAISELRPEDELFLTISLSEPFQADALNEAHCFKLVAAVIVVPPRDLDRLSARPGFAVVHMRNTPQEIDLCAYPDPFPEFSATPMPDPTPCDPKMSATAQSPANQVEVTALSQSPAYSVQAIRQTIPRAYERWSPEEDTRLLALQREGKTVKEMAREFQRQPGAIRSRLKKLLGAALDCESDHNNNRVLAQ